jgi:hypothetical protein
VGGRLRLVQKRGGVGVEHKEERISQLELWTRGMRGEETMETMPLRWSNEQCVFFHPSLSLSLFDSPTRGTPKALAPL